MCTLVEGSWGRGAGEQGKFWRERYNVWAGRKNYISFNIEENMMMLARANSPWVAQVFLARAKRKYADTRCTGK